MSESQSGGAGEIGRTGHNDRVAQAKRSQGIEWADCGEMSIQDDSGSLRPAWPREYARQVGVGPGTEVQCHVHTPTGAAVYLPPGVTIEDFLEAVL